MSFPLPLDRLRPPTEAQQRSWLGTVAPGEMLRRILAEDDEDLIIERMPVGELIALIDEAKREAVCPVCGARQDGVDIVGP